MPCYGGQLHIDACKSLLEAAIYGVPFQWFAIGNESLISRARNYIFAYFLKNPQFTKLLFIDADMFVSGLDIKKLYESEKDIVGAAVRLKSEDYIYNFTAANIEEEGMYYKVDKLGTAVLCISRKAAEDIAGLCKSKGQVYSRTSICVASESETPEVYYDAFPVGVKDGLYLSEDYFFCKNARDLGYNIYVDREIITIHNGMMPLNNDNSHKIEAPKKG